MSRAGMPANALPGLVNDLRENLAFGTPMMGLGGDPFQDIAAGDMFGDPYETPAGSAAAIGDLQNQLDAANANVQWLAKEKAFLLGAIESITAKKIPTDWRTFWLKNPSHNNGVFVPGSIKMADGTVY